MGASGAAAVPVYDGVALLRGIHVRVYYDRTVLGLQPLRVKRIYVVSCVN